MQEDGKLTAVGRRSQAIKGQARQGADGVDGVKVDWWWTESDMLGSLGNSLGG
jgi:hypothetical protein